MLSLRAPAAALLALAALLGSAASANGLPFTGADVVVDRPGAGPPATGNSTSDRYRSEVFDQVEAAPDLHYRTATDAETGEPVDLYMDLYLPGGDTLLHRPTVVLFSPGGFVTGDRTVLRTFAESFARRGFVAATIDYRVRPNAGIFSEESEVFAAAAADAAADAEAAIRWLRASSTAFGIDVDAIAAVGASAGGIVALDLTHLATLNELRIPGLTPEPLVAAAVSLAGGFSPLTFGTGSIGDLSAVAPPVLAVHGRADPTVRFSVVEALCDEMVAMGRTCTLDAHDTDHHGILVTADIHLQTAAEFLADVLAAEARPGAVVELAELMEIPTLFAGLDVRKR